ncbi:hypothetical protein [Kribbella jiaozuonensis]|uniref:Gram-positive cocci surface proteins LPxTG domain-containing protein n=1 Tax=Kribbella jiaozuonensis TaxID=2575441 RepID=A0A4U3LKK2_9ACTN|nr:hypothetical protein [Kribbella jiaozuonensis]TKK76255.1 hypothetical protein FDA38_27995 [Kribbella jiaozuonensis]
MNILNLLATVLLANPTVTMNHDELTARLGQTLTVESVVNSPGAAIAHLNVVSLDGVYVDLEDWTQDVAQPVPAGGETQLDWEFQAVNPGHFAVYVVLIPRNGALVAGPAVHVTVAPRQNLDTTGALTVAIAVPLLLGAGVLLSHRRTR